MSDALTPQEFIENKLHEAGFFNGDGVTPQNDDQPQRPALAEGDRESVVADRYERNRAARQACIEAHGATCAICGFDFGETYGPHFENIIQVHHIVPLHETAERHEVDPIHDLIPVCPNCHVALHAKPNGTYTPDELRAIIAANRTASAK